MAWQVVNLNAGLEGQPGDKLGISAHLQYPLQKSGSSTRSTLKVPNTPICPGSVPDVLRADGVM